jgi:glycosyltransferase involved in cell wall biosynthesis
MQIHQFSATVSYGDATSNQMHSLQRMLTDLGYESEIFCERFTPHYEGNVQQIANYDRCSAPENVLLLHFGLGYSPQVTAWLARIPDRKVLVYHNITPHRYFGGINYKLTESAQAGRAQLSELSTLVDAGWGDSAFNCQELAMHGWTNPSIMPIIFDPYRYAEPPDQRVKQRWQNGFNVLFVGRVSPNKCFEDLILTFYYLKRFVRSDARLLLVGSGWGLERYLEFLQALVARLGLTDVVFTGHVSNAHLFAYYQCADVYLSMSEHEGFGVPFLECMHFGVPIVAYKAAAVPETLGKSGALIKAKDYVQVAEFIGLLGERADLCERLVARQRERLKDFLPDQLKETLRQLLSTFETRA